MKIGFFEFDLDNKRTIDEIIRDCLKEENEYIEDSKTPITEANIFSITETNGGIYRFKAWYKYEEA